MFFFFKQKTAYEMRISDWSSDVCSSDLKDRGFRFIRGEMDGLDREGKTVSIKPVFDEAHQEVLPRRKIAYDTLILAVGSRSNFFGTPGADKFAMAIDSTQQAETFRLKLLSALARADSAKANRAGSALRITIVGAGATGVELAAELTHSCADVAFFGDRKGGGK